MTSNADPDNVWIYHERQQALLCGQHALNNLAQKDVFTVDRLAYIAQQLDNLELDVFAQNNEGGRTSKDYINRLNEGSHHVDETGNFSIEVLKAAVQEEFNTSLPHLSALKNIEITDLQGFICHKSDHWFAIRNIGGRFWNLNSMLERPEVISHFTLATEMEQCRNQGYTVFCIPSGLPQAGIKHNAHCNKHAQWHRMSDLLRGRSTQADPWEKLHGAGMRLDGKQSATTAAAGTTNSMVVDGLTEEEMLQMAMQASMEPNQSAATAPVVSTTPVSPEPEAGTAGAIRIQFRMPNNKRMIRRFMEMDPVRSIYSFVINEVGNNNVELKSGFPPKDLLSSIDQTIQEAKLANETIQIRII